MIAASIFPLLRIRSMPCRNTVAASYENRSVGNRAEIELARIGIKVVQFGAEVI